MLRRQSTPPQFSSKIPRNHPWQKILSHRKHLENTAAKLRWWNNILQKLCGTSWGSTADTSRISAIGLIYSAAEYGLIVHAQIDVQLNATMMIISGILKLTAIYGFLFWVTYHHLTCSCRGIQQNTKQPPTFYTPRPSQKKIALQKTVYENGKETESIFFQPY